MKTKDIIKALREDFNEYINFLQESWKLKRQSWRMSLAIRLADLKQAAFNKQYHVMILDLGGRERLVTINKLQINAFKRKKWLPKNADMLTLSKSFFYSTPLNRNNKSKKEDRVKALQRYKSYCINN